MEIGDDDIARLAYLHAAASEYSLKVPALSRHLIHAVQETAYHNQIGISDAIERRFCDFCGSIFVAGRNCAVELSDSDRCDVSAKGRKSRRKQYANHLLIKCGACQKTVYRPGFEKKRPSNLAQAATPSLTKTLEKPLQTSQSKSKTPAGKLNSLKSLVKSSSDAAAAKKPGLKLGDFLKSMQ